MNTPSTAMDAGTLITVDWGTSNFRAALLNESGDVLDRIQAPRGILHLTQEEFPGALNELLTPWFSRLPGVPVLMAGMIGSADGMVEVPYLECPASLDDIADGLVPVPRFSDRPVYIVPGLSGRSIAGNHDVMRGEEIQILGAIGMDPSHEQTVCLPGTHSKWVSMDKLHVTSFSTSMTGDIYAAVRNHTLLRRFAAEGDHDAQAFSRGLAQINQPGGILHHVFSARTEVLLGDLAPTSAASFLSGMLIGEEVRAMVTALQPNGPVTLIGNDLLTGLYAQALQNESHSAQRIDGDTAAVTGLHYLASRAGI